MDVDVKDALDLRIGNDQSVERGSKKVTIRDIDSNNVVRWFDFKLQRKKPVTAENHDTSRLPSVSLRPNRNGNWMEMSELQRFMIACKVFK